MKQSGRPVRFRVWALAWIPALLAAPSHSSALQDPSSSAAASGSAPAPAAAPLPASQLQSLVAPIALYPDPLLTQCLVATTYPLDIVEAEQWLSDNASLTGDALSDAALKQPWDPSVQALTAFPTVLKQLASNVAWATNLGNAFLAQKDDVMAAVQTLRQQAQAAGKLQSSPQQTVSTQTVDSKSYVVIQPAATQVVYVPTYDPAVIWGPPAYPYPPIWYPPPVYGGGFAVGFAAGVQFGAWFGGGWGWGCGWGGHTTIVINNNNTYIHNHNTYNHYNRSGNSDWHHDPGQRGNVPYRPGTHNIPGRTQDGGRDTPVRPDGRGGPISPRDGQAQNQNRDAQNRNAQNRDAQNRDAQARDGQQDRRPPEGRIGNRDVGPARRQGAWGSGGQRARMTSARGHQSMGHVGGGRPAGGGGRRR